MLGIWFTNACNLNCSYCYIKQKSNETIDVDLAVELICKELAPDKIPLGVMFMGAESLTHFDELKEIVERVIAFESERKVVFFIATNGTLLTDEMKRWFGEYRDIVSLGLSYDGDDESQDMNRSNSSVHIDRDFFRETWPKQPWKMTISESTAPYVDRDVIALQEQGVPFTANVAYEESAWSDESVLQYELSLYRLANYYINHPRINPCNLIVEIESVLDHPEEEKQPCYCSAGISMFFYDMKGAAYPCHMLSNLVMPEDRTLKGKFFDKDTDYEDPRCKHCAVKHTCYSCLGANYLYRGDIRFRDPLHCKLYQANLRASAHLWIGRLKGKEAYTEREKRIINATYNLLQAFDDGRIGMKY
ncbi:MAG: radical SAM protein [Clostridia bacterium]|nr:radical SAM protein [Clostridia bacterium]